MSEDHPIWQVLQREMWSVLSVLSAYFTHMADKISACEILIFKFSQSYLEA